MPSRKVSRQYAPKLYLPLLFGRLSRGQVRFCNSCRCDFYLFEGNVTLDVLPRDVDQIGRRSKPIDLLQSYRGLPNQPFLSLVRFALSYVFVEVCHNFYKDTILVHRLTILIYIRTKISIYSSIFTSSCFICSSISR